jgi:hypothetical protein
MFTAAERRRGGSAKRRPMAGRVDVRASLREFSESLRAGTDPKRCRDILVLLWRWQRDPDLDEESHQQARELIQAYGKRYAKSESEPRG